MSALEAFNLTVFLHINADLSTPPWLITAASLWANQLIYLVPAALAGIWCWGNPPQRRLVLKIVIAILALLIAHRIIGAIWPQPRPFILKIGHTFFKHAPTPAFPSNHAGIFWAISIILITANARSIPGWLVFIAGMGVAWARVFLGVHFPLDMLGALCVAGIVCLAINLVWRRIEPALISGATCLYHVLFAYPIAKGWIRD